MPDVWINLAHVYFAQGNFALAVKMVSSSLFISIFILKSFCDNSYMLMTVLLYAVPELLTEVLL